MSQTPRNKMLTRMEEVRAQVAERDELIEIIAIALLTRKNVFILGDTGQAKSAVINLFRAGITGTNQFERLMSKQTDEEALFGRLDLSSLIPGGVPEEVLEKDQHYKKPFIPVVTEYLLLFHKQDALFFPFAVRRETTVDLRKEDIPGLTWHHLIRLTMEELSGRAKLSDLGDRLAAHPKAKKNPHFRDRIRATAYEHPGQYISCGNGFYALNYAVA